MSKTYLNPPDLFPSQQYGFSQIVATQGGKTIYLSGQVGWDSQEEMTAGLDLGAQTRKSLENVETAVRAAGGSRDDIVSLRIYIVGDHIHQSRPVRDALLTFFHPERRPASTWIGVPALANSDFLIEIEAIAVVDEV